MDFDIKQLMNSIELPKLSINLEQIARDLRNKLLRDNVDSINPIRYEDLTDEQKQELKVYRQALLEVPQQAGWPTQIEWPTKPSWL